jgi:hypothetical protein
MVKSNFYHGKIYHIFIRGLGHWQQLHGNASDLFGGDR